MHIGKVEKVILVVAGAALIGAGAFYLYNEYVFEEVIQVNKSKRVAIAKIEAMVNIVKVRKEKGSEWKRAHRNQKLYSKDRVFTQDDAYANIIYKNNILLNLEPNTLIKIEEKSNEINIGLERGFIALNSNKSGKDIKLELNGKFFNVNSSGAKLQIRNTENGVQDIIALDGSVEIISGNQKIKIKKGRRLLLSADDLKVDKDYIDIVYPTYNGKVETDYNLPLELRWNSSIEGSDFKVQISTISDFSKILKTIETKSSIVKYNYLNQGEYYWRVIGEQKEGKKISSAIFRFSIISVIPPVIEDLEINLDLSNKAQREVKLSWRGGEGWSYEVEIIEDQADIVFNGKSDVNYHLWKVTEPNKKYSWRVKSLVPESEWSEPGTITARYDSFLGNMVPNKKHVNPRDLKKGITLNWEGHPEDQYKIIISADENFKKNILIDESINTNRYFFKPSLGDHVFNKIFWKIQSLEYKSSYSGIATILLRNSIATLLTPVSKEIRILNVNDLVLFKWKVLDEVNMNEIQLFISLDDAFLDKEIVDLNEDNRENLAYKFQRSGQYYWKLNYIGRNRKLMSSSEAFVDVTLPNEIKAPRIYKKYNLRYRTRAGKVLYRINWEKVPRATHYVIEVFEDSKLLDIFLRKKADYNYYDWTGFTTGHFFYRIKTFGEGGTESVYTTTGRLIFPMAPLVD